MEGKNILIMHICASKDGYGAVSENCEGIYAAGDDIKATKADVYEAIRLIKKNLPEERWPEPIKGDFEIEWHFDAQAFLKYYDGILTNAAMERLTGINRKQLWNYANGVSKPREKAREKINNALHGLGKELLSVRL